MSINNNSGSNSSCCCSVFVVSIINNILKLTSITKKGIKGCLA